VVRCSISDILEKCRRGFYSVRLGRSAVSSSLYGWYSWQWGSFYDAASCSRGLQMARAR
jgi:hypothetical protein